MFKAHQLTFANFLELVLLKIPYGVLNHVVRLDEGHQLFAVYLPDSSAEYGRRWEGEIHVATGETVEHGLRRLHKHKVLAHWWEYSRQIREYGSSTLDAPDAYRVNLYRAVDRQIVEQGAVQAINQVVQRPTYRGSPVQVTLFAEHPFSPGVRVDLVGKLLRLVGTDEAGKATEPIVLPSLDADVVVAAVIQFLKQHGIDVVGDTTSASQLAA